MVATLLMRNSALRVNDMNVADDMPELTQRPEIRDRQTQENHFFYGVEATDASDGCLQQKSDARECHSREDEHHR